MASNEMDYGGLTVIVKDLKINAATPGAAGSALTTTELGYLDGLTAGTVTASKAVIVDSNKDITAFRNVTLTNVDAGASGTAGTVDVFPSTAAKGKIAISAADSAGDTTTTITNASQAGARTYTIPDGGASASFVLSTGTSTATTATSTELTTLAGATNANSSTGKVAILGTSGAVIFAGALTATGGVVAAGGFSVSPRAMHTGGLPPSVSTDFSDYTVVATEVMISEIFIPANVTVTGVALLNGSAVAGNVKVGLANSAGAVVATSASTAQSGTDAYQRIAFTGTYAAVGPATYYVLAFGDTGGGTSKINAHTIAKFGAERQTGQVYATGFTTITPPSTFTTATGSVASLY